MATPASSYPGRMNPWLDLVRSFAILLVLLRHGERALHDLSGDPQGPLRTLFMNGWIGVDLFFVLSGYLITRHLLRLHVDGREFGFGKYMLMRALRIVPAYYAMLLITAAGVIPYYPVSADYLAIRIGYHLIFLQDYLPSSINTVFWSLGVEEKFYLLAPVLIVLLIHIQSAQLRLVAVGVALTVAVLPHALVYATTISPLDYPHYWRAFRSPFHMSIAGLLVGVAMALAERDRLIVPSRRRGLAVFTVFTAVLVLWMSSHDFMAEITAFDVLLQPTLIAAVCGGIVLGAVQLARTPMRFSFPVRTTAQLSYSLYLVHYPLIPIQIKFALPLGEPMFWLSYAACSIAAATVLHLLVERPFLLLKAKIGRTEEQRLPSPQAVSPSLVAEGMLSGGQVSSPTSTKASS